MPSATFAHLNQEKRAVITKALEDEFSTHSLADAQVARIVKSAGIARGAFYKYFADLTDAYTYLYHTLVASLHSSDEVDKDESVKGDTAAVYVARVKKLVESTSAHTAFFTLHYTVNQYLVPSLARDSVLEKITPAQWAAMTLIHETIKDCLVKPQERDAAIKRLEEVLPLILGGESDVFSTQGN